MSFRAVILAAGKGNRISKVSQTTPKPLLTLDGQKEGITFIDWHIRCLVRQGVQEVILVGNQQTYGWTSQVLEDARQKNGVSIEWELNPVEDLSTSGSGHSLLIALQANPRLCEGSLPLLYMDADILYDPRMFAYCQWSPDSPVQSLVCPEFRDTNEEVLVFGHRALKEARLHGKGLLRTPIVETLDCLGEATGVICVPASHQRSFAKVAEWVVQFSTAKQRSEHEDISGRLMAMGRVSTVDLPKGFSFMECDTPEEYKVLTSEMAPRLLAEFGSI